MEKSTMDWQLKQTDIGRARQAKNELDRRIETEIRKANRLLDKSEKNVKDQETKRRGIEQLRDRLTYLEVVYARQPDGTCAFTNPDVYEYGEPAHFLASDEYREEELKELIEALKRYADWVPGTLPLPWIPVEEPKQDKRWGLGQ